MNPDNARILRITAAAGTELADAYSHGTLIGPRVTLIAPVQKKFKIHRTVILHAAWLDQASAHCPIFLTAASRRSLQPLSSPRHRSHGGPLPRRPANVTRANPSPTYLYPSGHASQRDHGVLDRISPDYPPETGMSLTRYAPLRRSPPSVLLQTRCPSTCMC